MYFKYGCYEFYKKLNKKKEVENQNDVIIPTYSSLRNPISY